MRHDRRNAKARPAKPISIMAHVEGSGTPGTGSTTSQITAVSRIPTKFGRLLCQTMKLSPRLSTRNSAPRVIVNRQRLRAVGEHVEHRRISEVVGAERRAKIDHVVVSVLTASVGNALQWQTSPSYSATIVAALAGAIEARPTSGMSNAINTSRTRISPTSRLIGDQDFSTPPFPAQRAATQCSASRLTASTLLAALRHKPERLCG